MAKKELNSSTVLKVAEEVPSLKPGWIIIEGGEPFLRRELFEIIEVMHRNEIRTYIISNGMLFNESLAKRFSELNVNLMISIDGADKKIMRK
jgi:Predicted Fe-S oxidoreductases